jgi:peptidoglycan L-alanyl-D-glutamate endopeptidase CwlK
MPPQAGSTAGSVTGHVTPGIVSKMFPATPIKNIKKNLPSVLHALDEAALGDKHMVLMALGTIRAETAGFEPISEGISRFNTDPGQHPFNKYDNRADLGNHGAPDGASFKGRGFVQLTGRANYTRLSKELAMGDQLVTHPDLGNDQTVAAKILARFLKDHEAKLRQLLSSEPPTTQQLTKARAVVNGGTHGVDVFIEAYRTGDKLIT